MDRTLPTAKQLEFLDWEIGMFFHFGLRTFYPGHVDWDNLPMEAEKFAPDALDCGQWMEAAKALGAKYAIMTCKHHDGFALWPSKFTDFSVKKSPWKDGKGDVVREFVEACRSHDIKVGLYYSPAQWGGEHSFAAEDDKTYDDYFVGQLSELMGNYGTIDYLWLDGCGSEGHNYDRRRIVSAVRELQPDIMIMGSVLSPGDDNRWIGNEDGFVSLEHHNLVRRVEFSVNTAARQLGEPRFMPAECDMRIRDIWFGGADNDEYIKQPEELLGNYEYTVGRGANMLLNVGPDQHGRICGADMEVLWKTGQKIKAIYGNPLPFGPVTKEEAGWTITRPEFSLGRDAIRERGLCNRLVLGEDLTDGQKVRAFRVIADIKGLRICVYRGETIGHKQICMFPAVPASKFIVEIIESDGECKISSMNAFFAQES